MHAQRVTVLRAGDAVARTNESVACLSTVRDVRREAYSPPDPCHSPRTAAMSSVQNCSNLGIVPSKMFEK